MSTPTSTPTEDVNANEGDGSSIMNEQQPQPQSVVQVPLEEAVAPTASDDDLLITMRNYPASTSTNENAEVPSPPQAQDSNESAQSLSTGMEDSAAAQDALASTDSNISMQGGRLWQAAAQEAERRGRTMDSTGAVLPASASQEQEMEGNGSPRRSGPTGPGSRFAETFMERTRSRADPNALFADPKAKDTTNGTLHLVLCSCCNSVYDSFLRWKQFFSHC
jgi:hypothetical protein